MSLQAFLTCLTNDQLRKLGDDLLLAGIAFENKQSCKHIFDEGRKSSSGKLKKIYAALFHAKPDQGDRMVGILVKDIERRFK